MTTTCTTCGGTGRVEALPFQAVDPTIDEDGRYPCPDCAAPVCAVCGAPMTDGGHWRCWQENATRLLTDVNEVQRKCLALRALVAEMLAQFTEAGHLGAPCHRTGWVKDDTITRWHQTYRETS